MSGKDRIALFPSRANFVAMKARIVSANKGLSLLKRKRDALELKLREITALRVGLAKDFHELFSDAIFSIAKANYLETDFKPALVIGSERADTSMRLTYTKTIGLLLPTFEPVIRQPESLPFTGLSRGGKQVEVIRDKFQELLKTIILLASYDYSIRTLQDAIRSNNMRLNGLEFVVIPRFNNTKAYISDELDEMEREEFYRLKRSQGKQRALKEKGKQKTPAQKSSEFTDAMTWTGEDDLQPQEEKFVPLPLSIFMKKKFASSTQTLISGRFPGSYEIISPTDSIVSGLVPTILKRSSFKSLILDTKATPSNNPVESQAPSTKASSPSIKPVKHVSLSEEDSKTHLAMAFSDTLSKATTSAALNALPNNIPPMSDSAITTANAPIASEPITGEPATSTASTIAPTKSSVNETSSKALLDSPSGASLPTVVPSSTSSYPDSSMATSSALIDIANLNEPSSSKITNDKVPPESLIEMSAQTDITGRYPRRSEMNSPQLAWGGDPDTAKSQTSVAGRHGRASNTEHGNTSESESDENRNQPNAE